jgi:gamma-D-glutamyl-L-lysine dipeptidyl-peptidase
MKKKELYQPRYFMTSSIFLATLSLLSYVSAPVAEMRESPKKESEVVSQAYFSEKVNVLQESQDWVKIETEADHYQGWVQKNELCEREQPFLSKPSTTAAKVTRCAAHLYSLQDIVYGPFLTLPFDSKLEVLEMENGADGRWIKVALVDGRQGYIQRGDITLDDAPLTREQMLSMSMQFLGLPYTWGGKSSFGYDCSGFAQMLYRQMGISLPRDSKDQILWEGFNTIAIDELAPGDLIYFGITEDKIRHVGMYLGDNRFIHASARENKPYLRISRLSDPEWNGSSYYQYRTARALKL